MTTLRKTYGICPIETARVNTAPVHIDRERDISWSRDIFTYSIPGHYFSVPDSDSISLWPDWQQKRFNFKCMKRLWNLLSLCSVLYDVHLLGLRKNTISVYVVTHRFLLRSNLWKNVEEIRVFWSVRNLPNSLTSLCHTGPWGKDVL